MSQANPWTQHRQSFWENKSGNPRLTLWLRTVAYAYGMHRRNGHAPLKVGELALILSSVDAHGQIIYTPKAATVSDAIKAAVDYGFLAPESCARCLVVPTFAIEGGLRGGVNEKCKQQHSRRRAAA